MRNFAIGLFCLVFFLGGCDWVQNIATPDTPTPLANPLVGTSWRLLKFGDQPIAEVSKITLHIGDRITGSAGCNTYQADYSVTQDSFQLSSWSITQMWCLPKEIMEQEEAYLDLFIKSAASRSLDYRIDQDTSPAELHLMDQDGQTILLYVAAPNDESAK